MTKQNGSCVVCGHSSHVCLCLPCYDGMVALVADRAVMLSALKAALLLAGDGDLGDCGEYSGAAITDQIRAAVEHAERCDTPAEPAKRSVFALQVGWAASGAAVFVSRLTARSYDLTPRVADALAWQTYAGALDAVDRLCGVLPSIQDRPTVVTICR